jgi:hypothetical protein
MIFAFFLLLFQYLDPGSGSYIFQILIAGLTAGFFFFSFRIRGFLAKFFKRRKEIDGEK